MNEDTVTATITKEQIDQAETHYQGQWCAISALERMIATVNTYGKQSTGKPALSDKGNYERLVA